MQCDWLSRIRHAPYELPHVVPSAVSLAGVYSSPAKPVLAGMYALPAPTGRLSADIGRGSYSVEYRQQLHLIQYFTWQYIVLPNFYRRELQWRVYSEKERQVEKPIGKAKLKNEAFRALLI